MDFEVSSATSKIKTTSGNSRKPHKSSEVSSVWEHFTEESDGDDVNVVCKHCKKSMLGYFRNGTSHLRNHFKTCPRRSHWTFRQAILKGKRKEDGDGELQAFVPDGFDRNIAREKIAKMVIMHELPFSFVEYEAFWDFVNYVQPLVGTMSRNILKNEIFKLYASEKSKTIMALENCGSRVAVTINMWTSSNQKKDYMVITAHFIDKSWQLQSRILRFLYVPSPHRSQALINCLMDWNVDSRLSTMTVDNCSTNDVMIKVLMERLDVDLMMLKGKYMHLRCCAHILNLIVKDRMKVIESVIEKIRDSVTFWTATPKRIERFEEVTRQMKIPCTRKLVVDCQTRWNSTYLMLTTALEYKEVFSRMKQCYPQYNCLPDDEEWKLASAMCEHLESFYNLTKIFSGTKYPTANIFFPLICDIRVSMDEWLQSPYEEIREMASKMLEKFHKYWDVIYEVLAVAVVLDPRYNKLYLKYSLSMIYGDDANIHIEKILDVCQQLYVEYKSKYTSLVSSSSVAIEKQGESSGSLLLASRRLAKRIRFFSEWESFRDVHEVIEKKSELDIYLEERPIKDTEDFDILNWWKTNREKYPILSEIVKDIMAISISTVASESAFNTSGRHLSPHRSRLHPNILEALICTQNWLWSSLQGIIPKNKVFTGEEILEDDRQKDDFELDLDLEDSMSLLD